MNSRTSPHFGCGDEVLRENVAYATEALLLVAEHGSDTMLVEDRDHAGAARGALGAGTDGRQEVSDHALWGTTIGERPLCPG